jgi:hypothetical protein
MLLTAKKISEISEEYFSAKRVRANFVEVYVNPTQSEIISACSKDSKRIRFTANAKNQKVFIWNAMNAIHYDMLPMLGQEYTDVYPNIIGGLAEVQGGKTVMVGWDNFHHIMDVMSSSSRSNAIEFLTKLFSYNWSWLDKYFQATNYINKRKLEFENYLQK